MITHFALSHALAITFPVEEVVAIGAREWLAAYPVPTASGLRVSPSTFICCLPSILTLLVPIHHRTGSQLWVCVFAISRRAESWLHLLIRQPYLRKWCAGRTQATRRPFKRWLTAIGWAAPSLVRRSIWLVSFTPNTTLFSCSRVQYSRSPTTCILQEDIRLVGCFSMLRRLARLIYPVVSMLRLLSFVSSSYLSNPTDPSPLRILPNHNPPNNCLGA